MKKRDPGPEELRSIVGRWQGKRVVVLGDMILDEFVYGTTDRVSREAPVVVVKYDGSSYSPGGAANAALNLSALGGKALPVGFIGNDTAGRRLKKLFASERIPVHGLIVLGERSTTTKLRVLAGDYHAQRQQIVRIDREQRSLLASPAQKEILGAFKRELPDADAVILSDYDQGLFSGRVIDESISLSRRYGVPVVADSRFRLRDFKGVTTATPNEIEAAATLRTGLAGDDAVKSIGRRLLKVLSASSVLVTRGRYGMTLFESRRKTRSVEVVGSSEATDVTGAGDTVAAAVALTLAAGGSMHAAMLIANIAASIVVMKRGTAVAGAREVLDRIDGLD